jgi:hypothetical protein
MARISRNIGIHGSGLSTSTDPRTSAGDHHSGWSNLQEKVGRCTLDPQLSLDSYSVAPRGPRASPERLLSLQRNSTNVMTRGSMHRQLSSLEHMPKKGYPERTVKINKGYVDDVSRATRLATLPFPAMANGQCWTPRTRPECAHVPYAIFPLSHMVGEAVGARGASWGGP